MRVDIGGYIFEHSEIVEFEDRLIFSPPTGQKTRLITVLIKQDGYVLEWIQASNVDVEVQQEVKLSCLCRVAGLYNGNKIELEVLEVYSEGGKEDRE